VGLFTGRFALATILIGFMSAGGLMLTYALNTWLPELMGRAGFSVKGSLSFLLVLNGGAIFGSLFASRFADRFGPKHVIVGTFTLAALSIAVLTLTLPLPVLLVFVAIAGLGTIGTQVLIYGFVSNYYPTSTRAAGVAWAAGFGRLGGIAGPLIGGLLLAAALDLKWIFLTFALIAVVGAVVTALVPAVTTERRAIVIEPAVAGDAAKA
jgi:MFS transporter, AAHS family, benzoate transport protein